MSSGSSVPRLLRRAGHAAAAARVGDAHLIWHQDRDLAAASTRSWSPAASPTATICAAGAIARFAPVMEAVAAFAADGGLVLGICNGFQVLCEAHLLPGALLPNTSRSFHLPPGRARGARTPARAFTRRPAPGDGSRSPSSTHGAAGTPTPTRSRGWTPAGSSCCATPPARTPTARVHDIAGVCNEDGNVFGLMPHPEHAVDALVGGSADGLRHLRVDRARRSRPRGASEQPADARGRARARPHRATSTR